MIRPLDHEKIRPSNVVLFMDASHIPMVHRVIRRKRLEGRLVYSTQGDHLSNEDGNISQDNILGKLIAVERGGLKIEQDDPIIKVLGYFATVRSLLHRKPRKLSRGIAKFIKKIPFFGQYLN